MASGGTANGTASGRTSGTVRLWMEVDGWGVIDSPDLPGGCRAEASVVEGLQPGQTLRAGQPVEVEWTTPGPGDFGYRAVRVEVRDDLQATTGG